MMIAVAPILYFGYKFVRKTTIWKPEEVDLYANLDEIEEHEQNFVAQPAA